MFKECLMVFNDFSLCSLILNDFWLFLLIFNEFLLICIEFSRIGIFDVKTRFLLNCLWIFKECSMFLDFYVIVDGLVMNFRWILLNVQWTLNELSMDFSWMLDGFYWILDGVLMSFDGCLWNLRWIFIELSMYF